MYVKGKDKDKEGDKKKGGRVYRDKADKKLQSKMEGKDTPFQNALRAAEAAGKKTFEFNGKLYAARPKPQSKPKGGLDRLDSKPGNVKTESSELPTPKRVAVPGKKGSNKVLAKDITGTPLFQKDRRRSRKNIAKMLKKRKRRRN